MAVPLCNSLTNAPDATAHLDTEKLFTNTHTHTPLNVDRPTTTNNNTTPTNVCTPTYISPQGRTPIPVNIRPTTTHTTIAHRPHQRVYTGQLQPVCATVGEHNAMYANGTPRSHNTTNDNAHIKKNNGNNNINNRITHTITNYNNNTKNGTNHMSTSEAGYRSAMPDTQLCQRGGVTTAHDSNTCITINHTHTLCRWRYTPTTTTDTHQQTYAGRVTPTRPRIRHAEQPRQVGSNGTQQTLTAARLIENNQTHPSHQSGRTPIHNTNDNYKIQPQPATTTTTTTRTPRCTTHTNKQYTHTHTH